MNPETIKETLDFLESYKPLEVKAIKETTYTFDLIKLEPKYEVIRVIDLFITLTGAEKLTDKKKSVLAYYMLYGYSKEIKRMVRNSLNMNAGNLNNMNCLLRSEGWIIADKRNEHKNKVNPELMAFKEYLLDKGGEIVLVNIK